MPYLPDAETRKEKYYSYLATGEGYIPEPVTREEQYLYYLCMNGGTGGGGGGTTDYNNLQNQPQINGVTLKGNKTSDDLKITADILQVDHGTADTTFTLPANEYHTWGEVSSLTLTLAAGTSGQASGYWFSFDSGATATTLSIPETVKTDIVVEPNTHYECIIVGDYMTFCDWGITA